MMYMVSLRLERLALGQRHARLLRPYNITNVDVQALASSAISVAASVTQMRHGFRAPAPVRRCGALSWRGVHRENRNRFRAPRKVSGPHRKELCRHTGLRYLQCRTGQDSPSRRRSTCPSCLARRGLAAAWRADRPESWIEPD